MNATTPEQMREEAQKLLYQAEQAEITASLEGRIAIVLHSKLCAFNHTDGCGWGYETKNSLHQWGGTLSSHHAWRLKARDMLKAGGYEKYLLPLEGD